MRSRTQNNIYISTNDFAKGIPIFFSSDGTVSTVSTDHFKQESLGTKHISIQGSRFNGIYKRFSIGLAGQMMATSGRSRFNGIYRSF